MLHKISEGEFLEAVEAVVRRLSHHYVFASNALEDVAQQAYLFALEALPRFDPARSRLEAFLMSHVRNRFKNWKRDTYFRPDPPCKSCNDGRLCGPDGKPCRAHTAWLRRNTAKASIAQPLDITKQVERVSEGEADLERRLSTKELESLIDSHLPPDLRAPYLRMRDGVSVPRHLRQQVQEAVLDILDEHGMDLPA